MNLSGKTALVTGGSRGIGRAIAIKLASFGVNIILNYSKSEQKAVELVNEIKSYGVNAIAIKADISKLKEAENLIQEGLLNFSKIDILVNNAGITKDALLMRMSEDEWDEVMNVNLKGTFNITKSLIRSMIKQKNCSIINIASVVGLSGNAGQCNYSASKAGIVGFTKSLAKEVAKKNIRVNAIAPGFIATEMTNSLSENVVEDYLSKIPLARLGKPDNIADAVVFLASDLAEYITGQVLVVDGGLLI